MDLVTFDSSDLLIACTSDTHNDVCGEKIPVADIFIHAGDLTDNGSLKELTTAFQWIAALPHRVKVLVAGNHDLGLDHNHTDFSQEAYDLFTSAAAQQHGIHYLDREVKTVALFRRNGKVFPLQVYGNPCQPVFLKSRYAFTYLPFPDPTSAPPWTSAPQKADAVNIWVMHSPPKGQLDYINIPPLTGCEVQRRKIADAQPLLCVFGHYHSSYGAERVTWKDGSNKIERVDVLPYGQVVSFSERDISSSERTTIFLNAAWMTIEKTKVSHRNAPWVVKARL